MEDKKVNMIDDSVNKDFNDVVSDITEFVDCAQRCILPHNTLMFNVIMNALEMMIMRSELEGRENEFMGIVTATNGETEVQCEATDITYNDSHISSETKEEVDAVIDDVMKSLGDA